MSTIEHDAVIERPESEVSGLGRLHEWVTTVDHKRLGLMYFSYLGGEGLYGAGSAPDVGWFAYAPLTERPFSPGNGTDYWILSILLTSVGTTATAINLISSIVALRCPGMTLRKMPVLV